MQWPRLQGALYSNMEYLLNFTAGVGWSWIHTFTPLQSQVSTARRTHQTSIRYSMALIGFTQQQIWRQNTRQHNKFYFPVGHGSKTSWPLYVHDLCLLCFYYSSRTALVNRSPLDILFRLKRVTPKRNPNVLFDTVNVPHQLLPSPLLSLAATQTLKRLYTTSTPMWQCPMMCIPI